MDHILNIRGALASRGLDGIFLTGASNVFYATGFPGWDSTALITADHAWFFTDSRYIEAATNAIKSAEVVMTDRQNKLVDRVNAALDEAGAKKLGIEERSMSYKSWLDYSDKLHSQLVGAQELMDSLRAVKSREELDIMIRAQRIAEAAFIETLANLRGDMTESELAAELVYKMICHGAEDKSFNVIAVSGEKSSMPHGEPENRKLKKGFLTIDFGAKFGGYCSDTTRTVCLGEPDEEMRRVYDTVLKAQQAGIAKAKGGLVGSEIDAAARAVIEDAGYGPCFGHSFGHSLGIDIHEGPNAAPGETRVCPVGAVISAEPGIYIPGRYGVRIEDVIYLTEDGCEDITNLTKELLVL